LDDDAGLRGDGDADIEIFHGPPFKEIGSS
jgi:hypothetical protein